MSSQNSPFVTLDQLFALNRSRRETALVEKRAFVEPTREVTSTVGYHLYVNITLNLALSAAEKDAEAQRFLDILQEYAAIASRAVDVTGARLLEVQGERLHFLVEANNEHDLNAVKRLLTLAYSIVNVAYDRLEPMAGTHWAGCKAAAYFGPAIILLSEVGGGSAVSLGRAANAPAKRLSEIGGVSAGHLAIPEAALPHYFGPKAGTSWREINLRTPSEALLRFVENEKRASLNDQQFYGDIPRVKLGSANEAFFDSLNKDTRLAPVKVQGLCLKADLDGFSEQVDEAFAKGSQALVDLVARFRTLLRLPELFAQAINARTILLPWAGDCATILVIPQLNEPFGRASTRLPVTSALTWHELPGKTPEIQLSMGTTKWTLGIAAGDATEGNDGYMLVAELSARGRYYRVAAGWAVRRADDGYQSAGLRGDDSVITDRDHLRLIESYKKAFNQLTSRFFRAGLGALQKARSDAIANATPNIITSSSVGFGLPSPRPHFK
jgi:hypothetical protein